MATAMRPITSGTSKMIPFDFSWTLENFPLYCDDFVTDFQWLDSEIEFSIPNALDYKFSFAICPRGHNQQYHDYVSLFLRLRSVHDHSVRLLFTLSIIDAHDEKRNKKGNVQDGDVSQNRNCSTFRIRSNQAIFPRPQWLRLLGLWRFHST